MPELPLTVSQIIVRSCLFFAGRLVSMRKVGLPKPAGVWLGYLISELLLPFVISGAHYFGS